MHLDKTFPGINHIKKSLDPISSISMLSWTFVIGYDSFDPSTNPTNISIQTWNILISASDTASRDNSIQITNNTSFLSFSNNQWTYMLIDANLGKRMLGLIVIKSRHFILRNRNLTTTVTIANTLSSNTPCTKLGLINLLTQPPIRFSACKR